jgi:hypothetical protein
VKERAGELSLRRSMESRERRNGGVVVLPGAYVAIQSYLCVSARLRRTAFIWRWKSASLEGLRSSFASPEVGIGVIRHCDRPQRISRKNPERSAYANASGRIIIANMQARECAL